MTMQTAFVLGLHSGIQDGSCWQWINLKNEGSTSQCAQPNTIKFEMSMEWRTMHNKFELCWHALFWEMSFKEYEKVLQEKRKALVSLKKGERKVALDNDLEKLQLLLSKKSEKEIFVKLEVRQEEEEFQLRKANHEK
nr:hyaluronan/mRNA-binding protein [Tanacetum cinerariifolium]